MLMNNIIVSIRWRTPIISLLSKKRKKKTYNYARYAYQFLLVFSWQVPTGRNYVQYQ